MNEQSRSGMVGGVIPGAFVRLLFEYLQARGIDSRALLPDAVASGVPEPLERYPVARWREWLDTAARVLNDPLLGLHLGSTLTPAHLGLMGYVFLNCGTLGAAMLRMQRFERLVYDVNRMRHSIENGSVVLEWGIEYGRPGALVDETALTAVVQFARDIVGRPFRIDEIAFVNRPPPDIKPYRDYFGGQVRFDQPLSRIRFPAIHLQLPLRQADPALLAVLEKQAQAMLAALPAADDIAQTVRGCIARLAREGEPSLERVAQALHLSERTLHRRLEERGCNFRALREETRRHMAETYLGDPRVHLAEIAHLLGFSEQSAFNRAFKRWSGVSPGAYRRSLTERT